MESGWPGKLVVGTKTIGYGEDVFMAGLGVG